MLRSVALVTALLGLLLAGLATIAGSALDACGIKVFGIEMSRCRPPTAARPPTLPQEPSPVPVDEFENARLTAELKGLELRLATLAACPLPLPPPEPVVAPPPPPPEPEPVREPDPPPPPPVEQARLPEPPPPPAPPPCTPREIREDQQLAVVLDASNSMKVPWEMTAEERRLIREFEIADVRKDQSASPVAIAMYVRLIASGRHSRMDTAKREIVSSISGLGQRPVDFVLMEGCQKIAGTTVPASAIGSVVGRVRIDNSTGTDLQSALLVAAGKMRPDASGRYTGVILLVTDGMQSCPGNACVAARLIAQQKPGLTISVVDLAGYTEIDCLAQGGGRVFRAGQGTDLSSLLREAQRTIDPNSCPQQPVTQR